MQQSDKHGSAVDDALKDERHQTSEGTHHASRPNDDPSGEPVALHAEVARFLGQSVFPAGADRLREVAAGNEATEEVLSILEELPGDREYHTAAEVLDALGINALEG